MRELLEYLARALVEQPEAVEVEQFDEDDGTVVLELAVADDDYGKIIGKGGRTANALRTVVKAAAVKEGRRVLVDIRSEEHTSELQSQSNLVCRLLLEKQNFR